MTTHEDVKVVYIGLTGKKRSGKDTVASFIQGRADAPVLRIAFADEVKRIASIIYGLDAQQMEALKDEEDARWGITPRRMFQVLGTECGRSIHQDTWVRALFREVERRVQWVAPGLTLVVVIPDVRFLNEAQAIRDRGGVIWRVTRPGLDSTDSHPSEVEQDQIMADHTIANDGSLRDLCSEVRIALNTRPKFSADALLARLDELSAQHAARQAVANV